MAGAENPRVAQQVEVRTNTVPSVPDVPAVGDISQSALRQILQALSANVNALRGDGAQSALTLEKAINNGLVVRRPPQDGGATPRPVIDPRTGYGGTTWSGVTVPPPSSVRVGSPGEIESLVAYAGFGGVYLVWSSPDRTGGTFRVFRAESNSRATAVAGGPIHEGSVTVFFDGAVKPDIIGDGTADGKVFYYWVESGTRQTDGTFRHGYWSGGEAEGVVYTLNPNTYSMVVADSILAGRLTVALELAVGGAIRSGKELDINGQPNTARGFYIDQNFFYFGSEDDGSYIRWDGDDLSISGTFEAPVIHGGVIDGATLAGNYVFVRDLIYERGDAMMPALAQYPNDQFDADNPYEVRYLVRNEVIETEFLPLPAMQYVGIGTTLGGYATVSSPEDDEAYTILPHDYPRAGDTNRADTGTVNFIVDVETSYAGSLSHHPFNLVDTGPAVIVFYLSRFYVDDSDPENPVSTQVDDEFNYSTSTTAYSVPANDPLFPGTYTPVLGTALTEGGFSWLSAGGTTTTLSDDTVVTIVTQYSVVRLRIPLTDHTALGRLSYYTLAHRVNLHTAWNAPYPGNTNWQISSGFEVDNTV